MTENGDPLENAIAERLNGIIKEEYLEMYEIKTVNEAKVLLQNAVNLYNNERPHMSIGNLTPKQIPYKGYFKSFDSVEKQLHCQWLHPCPPSVHR